jgi:hypothetical protein
MTMTASILHCWKNARVDLVALLTCACLLGSGLMATRVVAAESANADVAQLVVEREADGFYLTASLQLELPPLVEDALQKGVPMFFVAEADIFRSRWYWYDKRVLGVERHMRLAYQPLTRRWRLNVASGAITANSLGVALNQSFETLGEALAALRRISRWKIADIAEIDPEQKYSVEFRFRLDISQLPRPFQIGALGQADWNIATTSSQRLSMQGAK